MELKVYPYKSPTTPTVHSGIDYFEVQENGCLVITYKDGEAPNDKKFWHYNADEWKKLEYIDGGE